MYLTAQRVISPGGENGINGFLYEHGAIAWGTPPQPIAGSIGELVHTFIMVPPGNNKVVSYVDVVAPDGTSYESIRDRIFPWLEAQPSTQPLPWTGVVEDMRFGLHMVASFAKVWRSETARLLTTCKVTFDRYKLPASEEKQTNA